MHDPKLTPEQLREFQRLATEHGELTNKIVVDAARSPDSPLHGLFEWDNAKAAAAYRNLMRDSAPLN